jgi:hypothetical protein
MLAQEYANIRYEVHCPDCKNEGGWNEPILEDIISDGDGIAREVWNSEPQQCQFCCENKSSIFNGGTLGDFSLDGIDIKRIEPIEININSITYKSYNELYKMHGQHIEIYRQNATTNNPSNVGVFKTINYKYYNRGLCLGDRIFFIHNRKQHLINLDTHEFLYMPYIQISIDTIQLELEIS